MANPFSSKKPATREKFVLPVRYKDLTPYQKRTVREQYAKEQKQLCAHCEHNLKEDPREDIFEADINVDLFPENFFNHPVHLHHDHDTGMTIGAVHCQCNAYLWQYEGE